jgi:hypothetical protein
LLAPLSHRNVFNLHLRSVLFLTVLPRQTFLDIGCHGKTRPNDYVVAVGIWVKRGAGGYLTDITATWVLDTEWRKLAELTSRTVSCVVEQ